ncbi:GDSL-type esterase/lipase family protein [Arthrobacter sp. C152]
MGILDAPVIPKDSTGRRLDSFSIADASAARPGNRVAFLGDSITQSAWQNSTQLRGSSYPLYAQMLSGGRVLTVRNAGISGERSDQILARFDTDITPYKPNAVVILAGRNDIAQGITLSVYQANVIAMVAKTRAIGATPILGLIPPVNTGTDKPTTIKWNTWLRYYAAANGIITLDFYTLMVDPAAGGYLSTYNTDGTHPSVSGYIAMGQLVADKLGPLLPNWTPPLAVDNGDTGQLYPSNPILLTDSNADGVPDGWFAYGGSTGYAHALVTDANVRGKMMQITQSANASLRALQRSFTGFNVGDKVAVCGVMTTDGGVRTQVKATFTGNGGTASPADITAPITRGFFYQEYTVPTGTTNIMIDLIANAGTGVVSWGQVTPINLTALGLA